MTGEKREGGRAAARVDVPAEGTDGERKRERESERERQRVREREKKRVKRHAQPCDGNRFELAPRRSCEKTLGVPSHPISRIKFFLVSPVCY